MALAAVATVGVGFFLCHLPYGRVAAVLLSLAAGALAALSLLGLEKRAWLGWTGAGLNALFALVLVAFPAQLGLISWWPERAPAAASETPAGMSADGWVDAGTAGWEEDGVRVALTFAMIRPETAAPAARGRTESYLWIGATVTNGSTRTVEFTGWDTTAPGGPTLTTADGATITGRRSGKPVPTTLAPGKSAECLLAFEIAPSGQNLRLELPAQNYGGTIPVRFQIPHELILRK
jgi:hypothetical protein